MNKHNHNEAITRIASPDRPLPVLIPWDDQRTKSGECTFGLLRRLTNQDLSFYLSSRNAFQKRFGEVEKGHPERLGFTLELADAIAGRSIPKLRKAVRHAFGDERALAEFKAQPLMNLAAYFNMPLFQKTRLIVWWSDLARRLVVGIFCQDVTTALYMLALVHVGEIGSLGTCKRCHELFFRIKPTKLYCSDRCQSADAMARMRRRNKRRSRKKARQS